MFAESNKLSHSAIMEEIKVNDLLLPEASSLLILIVDLRIS